MATGLKCRLPIIPTPLFAFTSLCWLSRNLERGPIRNNETGSKDGHSYKC
jgi:hypothetical protein